MCEQKLLSKCQKNLFWQLSRLKGPILYTFLEFIVDFDVLKNIYLQYKYHLSIFLQPFFQELC